jgi:Zn-dependent peptidase ImmA (M78 family)
MGYNRDILPQLLQARSLTRSQLSERLGIGLAELEDELRREPEPRQGILNAIATELALPPFVFFMERLPRLHDVIPDFRSGNPAPRAKSRATIESIQFAEGVQNAATEHKSVGLSNLPDFTVTQSDEIERFALHSRQFFNITLDDQKNAKDARDFYVICRKKIEDKGIFVLHDSFSETEGSGFCLAHSTHPVIVVNTKQQTRGRRLFTLIHELGHVLMRTTGISDPFITENATERLCNRFAGAFLVPRTYVWPLLGTDKTVHDPDYDDVRWAAGRLKISQQATVLRLEQLRVYKAGSHDKWKRIIHNRGNPDFADKGGGGKGPPAQEKVKLAKYGFQFARTFDDLLRKGLTTEINVYRSTGLKPKYQRPYFDYAKSITSSELQTLELDDD